MPAALPTNRAVDQSGHINDTNTMHEFRNRVVSVGRNVLYVDASNGSDSNDGFSLAYPKQTVGGALGAASNGTELRFLPGNFNITSGIAMNQVRGLRLQGAGGISRNQKLGTRFVAKTNGMKMLHFLSDTGSINTEGPEIANIDFVDDTPTGHTATLLHLDNTNRWWINRCSFHHAAVGLLINKASNTGGGAGDNAWSVIDGVTNFTDNDIGLHYTNGAGFRDFGSEFTNNGHSIVATAQHMKLFGSFIDNGPILLDRTNAALLFGLKIEAAGDPTIDIVGPGTSSWSNGGRGNVIAFCNFSRYAANPPATAYIRLGANTAQNVVVGNTWQNPGTRIVDNGTDNSTFGHPQLLEEFSPSNFATSRSFNAGTVSTSGLADVVATLINDLKAQGAVK